MKSVLATPLLVLAAALTNIATAATTADLQVKGQLTPGACTFVVVGSGTGATANYAYGDIDENTLLPGQMAELSNKFANFGIICSAPTPVGVRFTDNRSASEFGGSHPSAPDTTEARAGLGNDASGNPIGFAILGTNGYPNLNTLTGSGGGAGDIGRFLYSPDGGNSWAVAAESAWGFNFEALYSFSDVAGQAPIAIGDVAFRLGLRAFLAPKESLDVSREITLDGNLTAELVYL